MTTMFSGNQEKQIPKSFKDCYKTDAITQNLWVWCERLEKLGKILFWILIVIGIIDTIISAVDAHQFLKQIGADTIREIRRESAKLGMEIPTAFETLVHKLLMWTFYAAIEYCVYHVIALLVGSLANIVQHIRISADIALYNAAKTENVADDSGKSEKEEVVNNPVTNYIICEKCGSENISSQIICRNCGESLKQATYWVCSNCKKTNLTKNDVCWNCGKPMP